MCGHQGRGPGALILGTAPGPALTLMRSLKIDGYMLDAFDKH